MTRMNTSAAGATARSHKGRHVCHFFAKRFKLNKLILSSAVDCFSGMNHSERLLSHITVNTQEGALQGSEGLTDQRSLLEIRKI